jgi:hypothetical protein
MCADVPRQKMSAVSFFDGLGSVLGSIIGDIVGDSLSEKMEKLEGVRNRRRTRAAAAETAPEDGSATSPPAEDPGESR